jgi:hypothetical protein
VVVALIGETAGVISNGVETWLVLSRSKDARLDGGLVNVESPSVVRSGLISTFGCFVTKRPEVSLICPKFFVVASIAE